MLVKKLARRRSSRQQPQHGPRPGEESGLNWHAGGASPHRNNPNLGMAPSMESDEPGRQSNQRLSDNRGEGMETESASTENHGSRFRALANLDLNANLEANMESAEILGDREDSLLAREIVQLDDNIRSANVSGAWRESIVGNMNK